MCEGRCTKHASTDTVRQQGREDASIVTVRVSVAESGVCNQTTHEQSVRVVCVCLIFMTPCHRGCMC